MTRPGDRSDPNPRPHPGGPAGPGPVAPEADLASRWLGSSVVAASDESFGDKENLLTPGAPAFEPGHYGNRGEIVDGWETRRRRDGGHDWVVVRLGTPGVITSVDGDTSFFTGNYPESCCVEACGCEGYPGPAELASPATSWVTIVPRSPLRGDEHNVFEASDPRRFTHVRLSIFPDGGIARLRVTGRAVPDPRGLETLTIDLASQQYGGAIVASSDDFYTAASMLNRPGRARQWARAGRPGAGAMPGAITLSSASLFPVWSAGLWSTPPISSTTHRPKRPSTAVCRTLFRPATPRPGYRCSAGPACSLTPGTSSRVNVRSRSSWSALTPSPTEGCRGCG